MKTIKELEKEIEEEEEKRPIRCFAEAMKYGGDSEGEEVRILKAKLRILKEVLRGINKRLDFAKKEREKVHKKYPETKLTPRLDSVIDTLEELKQKITGEEK